MRPRRNRRQCEFAWCEFACTSSTWRSWWSSSSGSEYRCDRSRASSSVLQTASFTVEPYGPTADVEDSKEPVTQRAAGPRFYPGPQAGVLQSGPRRKLLFATFRDRQAEVPTLQLSSILQVFRPVPYGSSDLRRGRRLVQRDREHLYLLGMLIMLKRL